MKRFLFAVAAVALIASVGSAEDKPVATAPATATPVIVGTPGTVIESAPATTAQRRGLFSRLRNRGNNTATTTMTGGSTVVAPGTVINPAPTPMPPIVPAPMPMPGTKTTPGAMAMPSGITVAGGTDSGMVTTAGYSEPAQRRGLFGRLRNR